MGFHIPILITVLSLLLLPQKTPAAGSNGCLSCHRVHYGEQKRCIACHRGNDNTDRKLVAHEGIIPGRYSWFTISGSRQTAGGNKLADNFGCRRCHILGKRGNRLAMGLDSLSVTRRADEIAQAIEKPAQSMPDFHFSGNEITDLVNAILFFGKGTTGKSKELPLVVHFTDEGRATENIFEEKCGGCHRLLSAKYGGLGKGDIGPNLSGFLTPFYPESLDWHGKWGLKKLRDWLENPRRFRGNAQMPPVPLGKEEFRDLEAVLKSSI